MKVKPDSHFPDLLSQTGSTWINSQLQISTAGSQSIAKTGLDKNAGLF